MMLSKWSPEQRLLGGVSDGLDGKALRGSHDRGEEPVELLAPVLNERGTVIGLCDVESETNEMPMVAHVLEEMDLRGAVATADALQAQTKTSEHLIEQKKAEIVFTLKEQQCSGQDSTTAQPKPPLIVNQQPQRGRVPMTPAEFQSRWTFRRPRHAQLAHPDPRTLDQQPSASGSDRLVLVCPPSRMLPSRLCRKLESGIAGN